MKQFNILRGLAIALMLICCNAVWAYDFQLNGIYYYIYSTADLTVGVTYGENKYSGDIVIPSTITYRSKTFTVTGICPQAFNISNDYLTSVEIPNSVTKIGQLAFCDCKDLTNVEIPNSVTSIALGAFSGCTNLRSVKIPNSVTSIENAVFYKCTNLRSVKIPNSVTMIGDNAFKGCTNLTNVEIPNSVTSIGKGAFSGCKGLIDVKIPNSVTSIEAETFRECTNLTSVEIPNSVTSIGASAFIGCMAITSITIPKSVQQIKDGAFKDCKALKSIYVMAETPPSAYSVFKNELYMDAVLYVPNGCLEAYQNAEVWKEFWEIKEFDVTGIGDVKADNENATTVYDLNGRVVENPTKGIYIINGKKVLLK